MRAIRDSNARSIRWTARVKRWPTLYTADRATARRQEYLDVEEPGQSVTAMLNLWRLWYLIVLPRLYQQSSLSMRLPSNSSSEAQSAHLFEISLLVPS